MSKNYRNLFVPETPDCAGGGMTDILLLLPWFKTGSQMDCNACAAAESLCDVICHLLCSLKSESEKTKKCRGKVPEKLNSFLLKNYI